MAATDASVCRERQRGDIHTFIFAMRRVRATGARWRMPRNILHRLKNKRNRQAEYTGRLRLDYRQHKPALHRRHRPTHTTPDAVAPFHHSPPTPTLSTGSAITSPYQQRETTAGEGSPECEFSQNTAAGFTARAQRSEHRGGRATNGIMPHAAL